MISAACDITAYAQNRFGGIARVCYHTVEELSRNEAVGLSAYFTRGRKPELPGVAIKHFRPWSRIFGGRYDIAHSLCHRRLEVTARRHIYTVHDVWSLEPNNYQSRPFQQKLGARMRREILAADLVLTDSNSTRSKLLQFGLIEESKCLLLPAGVSVPDPTVVRPTAPSGLSEDSRAYVLFVGRLENRKNLPHILEAVRPITNLRLVLVGEPGYGFEETIKAGLASFPADRLTTLSHVSESELLWLYRHAVAALQPSWDEGFGLPLLEAMAAGCPVITSNCSAMAEVAGEAGILVDPNDPEQSRLALERLIEEPSYREHLIEAGTVRAREYSWGSYGKRLVQIYQTLLTGA